MAVRRGSPTPLGTKALSACLELFSQEVKDCAGRVSLLKAKSNVWGTYLLESIKQLEKLTDARVVVIEMQKIFSHINQNPHFAAALEKKLKEFESEIEILDGLITTESARIKSELPTSVLPAKSPDSPEAKTASSTDVFKKLALTHIDTILITAIERGEREVVQGFLAYAPEIFKDPTKFKEGFHPILMAAMYGQLDILDDLLTANPAAIRYQCKKGRNILHYAAQFDDSEQETNPCGYVRYILDKYRESHSLIWEPDHAGAWPVTHATHMSINTPMGSGVQLNTVRFLVTIMNDATHAEIKEAKRPTTSVDLPAATLNQTTGALIPFGDNLVKGLRVHIKKTSGDHSPHTMHEVYDQYQDKGVKCVVLVPTSPDESIKCYFLDNAPVSTLGIETKRIVTPEETKWSERAQFIADLVPHLTKKLAQDNDRRSIVCMGIGVGGVDAMLAAQKIKELAPAGAVSVITFNSAFVGPKVFAALDAKEIPSTHVHTGGFKPAAAEFKHADFQLLSEQDHLKVRGTDIDWAKATPLAVCPELKSTLVAKPDFNQELDTRWPEIKATAKFVVKKLPPEAKEATLVECEMPLSFIQEREFRAHAIPYKFPLLEDGDQIPIIEKGKRITTTFHSLLIFNGIVVGLLTHIQNQTLHVSVLCRGTACGGSAARDTECAAGLTSMLQAHPIIIQKFCTAIGGIVRNAKEQNNTIEHIEIQAFGHSLGGADQFYVMLHLLRQQKRLIDHQVDLTEYAEESDYRRGCRALATQLGRIEFNPFNHPGTTPEKPEEMAALIKYFGQRDRKIVFHAFVVKSRRDPVESAGWDFILSSVDPEYLRTFVFVYECTLSETVSGMFYGKVEPHQRYLYRNLGSADGNAVSFTPPVPTVFTNEDEAGRAGIALEYHSSYRGLGYIHPVFNYLASDSFIAYAKDVLAGYAGALKHAVICREKGVASESAPKSYTLYQERLAREKAEKERVERERIEAELRRQAEEKAAINRRRLAEQARLQAEVQTLFEKGAALELEREASGYYKAPEHKEISNQPIELVPEIKTIPNTYSCARYLLAVLPTGIAGYAGYAGIFLLSEPNTLLLMALVFAASCLAIKLYSYFNNPNTLFGAAGAPAIAHSVVAQERSSPAIA